MTAIDALRTEPKTLAALRKAAETKTSPDELYKQRISFVYGNVNSDSGITRAKIESVLHSQIGATEANAD